jgi:hypothetical protein
MTQLPTAKKRHSTEKEFAQAHTLQGQMRIEQGKRPVAARYSTPDILLEIGRLSA